MRLGSLGVMYSVRLTPRLSRRYSALSLAKSGNTSDEGECVAIEEVRDAIGNLVGLIKAYQSKNKVAQVMMSTLFKRRQEEAEAVIDRAMSRLQVRAAKWSCVFVVPYAHA